MKSLYYTLSNFHKAVKRNKPEKVYYDDCVFEFHFFTQKAIIVHSCDNELEACHLIEWLSRESIDLVNVLE